jgi:mono/diheme cytochrome c family protein
MKALLLVGLAVLLGVSSIGERSASAQPVDDVIARGRLLVNYGGCNDCHTAGWMQNPGGVPEAERLTGVPIGFSGPWGTSYAINLRLFFARVPEARWSSMAAGLRRSHPPMPWWNIEQLPASDLHAIYAYVHSLGETGGPVPDFVAPGGKVTTPVIHMEAVPASP